MEYLASGKKTVAGNGWKLDTHGHRNLRGSIRSGKGTRVFITNTSSTTQTFNITAYAWDGSTRRGRISGIAPDVPPSVRAEAWLSGVGDPLTTYFDSISIEVR